MKVLKVLGITLLLSGCVKVADEDISLLSGLDYELEVNSDYDGLGGTCHVSNCTLEFDKYEVDITELGEYEIVYNAVINEKVKHSVIQKVKVVDTTAPSPIEYDSITLEVGTEFVDPGVVFTDNYDDTVTVYSKDVIETDFVGRTSIFYSVTDSFGNTNRVERLVYIKDTTGPVITLNGERVIILEAGKIYEELGGLVDDNYDTDVELNVKSSVNTGSVGTYYVTYNAKDSFGNDAVEVVRTVHIKDTIRPSFDDIPNQRIQIGSSDIDWSTYIQNATDNSDSELILEEMFDPIDYFRVGQYIVSVKVTDGAGNYQEEMFVVTVALDAVTDYGYEYLSSREDSEKAVYLYEKIVEEAEAFLSFNDDIYAVSGYFPFAEFDTTMYSYTTSDISEVIKMLKYDHPEFYWIRTYYHYSEGEIVNKIGVYVNVHYASFQNRLETQDAIAEMSEEVFLMIDSSMSDLEKVTIVYDYIIERTDYSYESDGETPKLDYYTGNIDGVASELDVVCEGYSVAFKYLLDMIGIDNLVVTGSVPGGGRHTWNIAKIDSKYYYFELTWQDGYWDDYYFFGETSEFMDPDHIAETPEGVGRLNLYLLPEISEKPIKP